MSKTNVQAFMEGRRIFQVVAARVDICKSNTIIYLECYVPEQSNKYTIYLQQSLKSINIANGVIMVYFNNDGYLILTKAASA